MGDVGRFPCRTRPVAELEVISDAAESIVGIAVLAARVGTRQTLFARRCWGLSNARCVIRTAVKSIAGVAILAARLHASDLARQVSLHGCEDGLRALQSHHAPHEPASS